MFLSNLPFSYEGLAEEFFIFKRKHSSSFLREHLSSDFLKLNVFDRYSLSQVQLKPFRRGETYHDKSPRNSWLNTNTSMFCGKLTQQSIEISQWIWIFGYEYPFCFTKPVNKLVHCFLCPDAPTFVSNQTMYYSWEGNPINISCEVLANPSASVQWKRGKLVLPVKNTTHLKTYSTGRKLILEVRLQMEINVVAEHDFVLSLAALWVV